ncbi:MAG: sensor histidine kinase [Litoreibacter sp.]|nr:sensor histidine kinase [Litoreibacter sp.]
MSSVARPFLHDVTDRLRATALHLSSGFVFLVCWGSLTLGAAIWVGANFAQNGQEAAALRDTNTDLTVIEDTLRLATRTRLAQLEWLLDPSAENSVQLRHAQVALGAGIRSLNQPSGIPSVALNLLELRQINDAIMAETGQLSAGELRNSFLHGELNRKSRIFFEKLTRERIRLETLRLEQQLKAQDIRKATLPALILIALLFVALFVKLVLRYRRDQALALRATYLEQVAQESDRADILARELNHRVKNLFAVISAIVSMTARTESEPLTAARKTALRIEALARAHEISTNSHGLPETAVPATVTTLLDQVVAPYKPEKARFKVRGDNVILPPSMVTPLGLITSELATNALKYGAWSTGDGVIEIDLHARADGQLKQLIWTENGGPRIVPDMAWVAGFGTTLIDLSLRQLNGRISRTWAETGLRLTLQFAETSATTIG